MRSSTAQLLGGPAVTDFYRIRNTHGHDCPDGGMTGWPQQLHLACATDQVCGDEERADERDQEKDRPRFPQG